jgi:hypothetical protein
LFLHSDDLRDTIVCFTKKTIKGEDILILYHAIRKTYDDFEEVFQYRFDGENGTLLEADKELKPGQIIIIRTSMSIQY